MSVKIFQFIEYFRSQQPTASIYILLSFKYFSKYIYTNQISDNKTYKLNIYYCNIALLLLYFYSITFIQQKLIMFMIK